MNNSHYAARISALIGLLLLVSCGGEDATPPRIEFQAEASQVLEGESATIPFSIPLPEGVTPTITVSGTASETTDYSYTVSPNGLVFNTEDDNSYDPNETVVITITGFNKGATTGTRTVHTLTITETPIIVEFQGVSSNRIEGQSLVAGFNLSLPEGVVPTYKVSGTATLNSDFSLTQNSNGFVFTVSKDQVYENAEAVIIELTAISGNATLGQKKLFTLNIADEDESSQAGLRIDLTWEPQDMTVNDADVDLLVWLETSPGVYTAQGGLWSAIIGTSPEFTFIPSNETDGKYALSYVYYNGTSNNLKVKVDFRSFKGNLNGTTNRASFTKNYTSVNINTYPDPYNAPLVVAQTFNKAAADYNNLTDFAVAPAGSRSGSPVFILDEASRKIIEAKRIRYLNRNN